MFQNDGSCLSVTFTNDEVERAKDRWHVGDHVAWHHMGKDGKINKGRGADFHSVRYTATLRVDVETKFTLRVFRAKVDFSSRCLDALCSNCLLYTSPSPRDQRGSRMPSSA